MADSKLKSYALVFVIGLAAILLAAWVTSLVEHPTIPAPDKGRAITTAEGFTKQVDFPNVALKAQAAVVYDSTTGEILFEKNGNVQLPLASLTKIMTAYVASAALPKGATVEITKESLSTEGDSGFKRGEEWHLKDLLNAVLVESSNDGAAAVASVAGAFTESTSTAQINFLKENGMGHFVELMNERARALGLGETYFLNPTGLDQSEAVSGGYGSARDVALLFDKAVRSFPDVFEATRYSFVTIESLENATHKAKNTNTEIGSIPAVVASKTGFTDLAGGNLAVMFEAGPMRPVVVVVLGSTKEGRFEDTAALAEATLRYINISSGE